MLDVIEGPPPEPDGVRCCVCETLIDWRDIRQDLRYDGGQGRLLLPCGCTTQRPLRVVSSADEPLRFSWEEPDA